MIDDEILDFLNKKYKKDIVQKDKTDDYLFNVTILK